MAGHHDYPQAGKFGLNEFEDFDPVDPRQPDIKQDEARYILIEPFRASSPLVATRTS